MLKGTIIKGIGGFYYVNTEKGVFECRARGIFRKEKIKPMVGDSVKIQVLDELNKKGNLERIEKRKNSLIRPKVANIDKCIVVVAAESPKLNVELLDKLLILVSEQNMDSLICINKIDLDKEGNYEKIAGIYKKAGYDVVCVSAKDGIGLYELKAALYGKTSVLAGPSGVGKSSILNALNPSLFLETGEISRKIERGRHTTRHTELIEVFPGGHIVDSPGFTSLELLHIPKEELKNYYREFIPLSKDCYFNGCVHINEPDCAVKDEIGKSVSEARYKSYINLYNELEEGNKYV